VLKEIQVKHSLRLAAVSILLVTAFGQATVNPKGNFSNLEISSFTVKPGVGFPADYMSKMQADLVNEIAQKHRFKQVYGHDNKPSDLSGRTLRLEGEIIEYKAGSQAARYLIGMGAGKTKVVAHVRFIDSATNEVVFEDNVDGKVVMGLFGGSSPGATRGLAKEVASKAVKAFF
jgi:hypothetical protein